MSFIPSIQELCVVDKTIETFYAMKYKASKQSDPVSESADKEGDVYGEWFHRFLILNFGSDAVSVWMGDSKLHVSPVVVIQMMNYLFENNLQDGLDGDFGSLIDGSLTWDKLIKVYAFHKAAGFHREAHYAQTLACAF
eukprot:gene11456-12810_t